MDLDIFRAAEREVEADIGFWAEEYRQFKSSWRLTVAVLDKGVKDGLTLTCAYTAYPTIANEKLQPHRL